METTKNWQSQVRRLKPFNGQLIPVKEKGHRADGPVGDHNYTVESILDFPNLKAIEVLTSLELMCIDLDSLEAINHIETKSGMILEDFKSWRVQRVDDRLKFFFKRTLAQQKLGELCLRDPEHDLEVFSKSSIPVTVIGHHRGSGLYRWYGTGPEKLSYCPEKIWNFIVELKQEDDQKKAPKTRKSTSRNWQPALPCPICNRSKSDCWIHKNGNLVQCHHGKTNHPPSLRIGETIHLAGIDWAFCKEGENAIGRFSLFKIHKPDPLAVMAKELGIVVK